MAADNLPRRASAFLHVGVTYRCRIYMHLRITFALSLVRQAFSGCPLARYMPLRRFVYTRKGGGTARCFRALLLRIAHACLAACTALRLHAPCCETAAAAARQRKTAGGARTVYCSTVVRHCVLVSRSDSTMGAVHSACLLPAPPASAPHQRQNCRALHFAPLLRAARQHAATGAERLASRRGWRAAPLPAANRRALSRYSSRFVCLLRVDMKAGLVLATG